METKWPEWRQAMFLSISILSILEYDNCTWYIKYLAHQSCVAWEMIVAKWETSLCRLIYLVLIQHFSRFLLIISIESAMHKRVYLQYNSITSPTDTIYQHISCPSLSESHCKCKRRPKRSLRVSFTTLHLLRFPLKTM